MHVVAILALDGVSPGDLAIPWEVFSRVRLADGSRGYDVRICGQSADVHADGFRLRAPWRLQDTLVADTLIVPGTDKPETPVASEVLAAVQAAHDRGARIASVCSGAFVLAAAGLLDGRRATTHWLAAPRLAARYPAVRVEADVLFVDEGRVLTSAGAFAGLDLCLHMVRRDHGQTVAAQAARMAVAPIERAGGQAQYIRREIPSASSSLTPLLEWAVRNADRPLTLADLAARANASPRTLERRFRAQTGLSPLQWLLAVRLARARELLETTALQVEEVAAKCGFPTAAALREHFRRNLGVTPTAYRRAFGGG